MGVCSHTTTVHFEKIRTILADWGEPAYRFRQVYEGATRGLVQEYSELTALPAGLRERLADEAPLRELAVSDTRESDDGTIKLGLTTHDGFPLEAVRHAPSEPPHRLPLVAVGLSARVHVLRHRRDGPRTQPRPRARSSSSCSCSPGSCATATTPGSQTSS